MTSKLEVGRFDLCIIYFLISGDALMTSRFDGFQPDMSAEDLYWENKNSTPDSCELLSAYIDGELSPTEKQQVQAKLDSNPDFKQLYIQLLNLQSQIQNFVTPPSEKSPAEIAEGVFRSIERERCRRRRWVWGGSAIAASLVATISGIIPGFSAFSPQMARVDSPGDLSDSVMLAVAIDRPAINIPKAVRNYQNYDSQTEHN